MRPPARLLSPLLLFCLTSATAGENATDHFLLGRKLLEEKSYAAAFDEFQKANELKPDLPEVQYGMGACLSALGKYPEAKEKLQGAFSLLQDRPRTVGSNWGPIDIGYYALLADIQANLGESEAAVETINKYMVPDARGSDQAQAIETLNTVKKGLSGKLLFNAQKCLGSGDLDCVRRALAQAEKLQPVTSETLMSIARGSLTQAERASAMTDEDKAKRSELYRMAVEFARRISAMESGSKEAKRVLSRALSGTKDSKDYQEAVTILTSLVEAPVGQEPPDRSILLDLTTVYMNGEEWDLAAKAASKFVELAPEATRAEGFCKRSYAFYRLGQYQNSLDDASKCTNADGTPRQLRHLDLCRREIEKGKAAEAIAAAQKESLGTECTQLNREVQWATATQNPELDVLVPIIARLESGKARCKGHLGNADTSELCRAGIYTASNPANLSTAKPAELKGLETTTAKFLKLCEAFLNEHQKSDVRDALNRISGKPSTSK